MLKAWCRLGQVCDSDGCAEYLRDAEGMLWRFLPASETKTTLLTCTVMLNDEWIALSKLRPLDIYARPTTGTPIVGPELSCCRPNDVHASLNHSRAICLDIVRGNREIQIARVFCQPLDHALLCFSRRANGDQFQVGIANHNNAIGGPARGMDSSATDCQTELLAKYSCSLF